MKVVVTGAGGYVGLNIVAALKETDHEILALVRKTTNTDYLKKFDVPIASCDILDYNGLKECFRGVDAVIHCAALTSGFKSDKKALMDTNVLGTKCVTDAAVANGVKRLVFTSTTSTIGIEKYGVPATEDIQLRGYRTKSQYGHSKVLAEQIILRAMEKNVEVVIINPAEVLGQFDYHFGWGSVIVGLVKNNIPFIPKGGGSFCHASEVGKAHVAALTSGRNGEKYILGGTDILYSEFFQKIAEITGCTLPKPNVFINSYHILKMVFGIQEWMFPWTKKHPPLDKTRLKAFYKEMYFSSEKAEKELGFKKRSIEDMIRDCYCWYQENSYIY